MKTITPLQLKLLDTAHAQGLLSAECYRQAKEWNSYIIRERENWANKHITPKQYMRSRDAGAKELAIQVVLCEITLTEKEIESQKKKLKLAFLKKKLEKLIQQEVESEHPEKAKEQPKREQAKSLPETVLEAIECLEQLQQLSKNLQQVALHEHLESNFMLSDADAALCLCWDNYASYSIKKNLGSTWDQLDSLENYRACQLLSARSAELVMQTYYSSLGLPVEDISLKQLDGTSEDWKTFDLRVRNRLIDVKNARHSLHGNGGYIEHCIPKFKEHRATFEQVVIAGVLSTYQKEKKFYRHNPPTATILGEVNVVDVRNLYRWAKMRFGTRLDIKGIWNPGFLPGWIFEYPNEHYPKRKSAIASIDPLLRRISTSAFNPAHLPGWMLLLCSDASLISSLALGEQKARLVSDLRAMSNAIGFSRRSLYVYAMGLALDALAIGKSPEEDINEFLNLIRIPLQNDNDVNGLLNKISHARESLLGFLDPQGYVSSLAQNLVFIGKRILELDIHLTGFRLTHPAILKGITSDSKTLTLMAFCGGWQSVPIRAKCGTTPLKLGTNDNCLSCGYLICHNCGHCSNSCPDCAPRQDMYAKTAVEEKTDFYYDNEEWSEIDDF